MKLAEIKEDNMPYCGHCGAKLPDKTTDYNVVNHVVTGKAYFRYDKKCMVCEEMSKYYVDMDFDNRYVFPNKDIV